MAKKKPELFINISNERELDNMLKRNSNRLICAEIYCSFAGFCTALGHIFVRLKLDWTDGQIILIRVLADEIESLKRFQNQSEPVYLFIVNKKILRIFRGVDNIRFAEIAKEEWHCFKKEMEEGTSKRRSYDIDEMMEEELDWYKKRNAEFQQEVEATTARVKERQAARKRHRAERMMGIFIATTPYCSKHIAYSVKQFESLNLSSTMTDLKLAFMVSMERDLAVLELMDLNPLHVSKDFEIGEEECAAMFPVDYGDSYPEFEDFDE